MYIMNEELRTKLLNYLVNKPWGEVEQIIHMIFESEKIEETNK